MLNFIDLEKRNNYGNEQWYVASAQRVAIQQLTGRKTVTVSDVDALTQLGFEFFCNECRKELKVSHGAIVHREE